MRAPRTIAAAAVLVLGVLTGCTVDAEAPAVGTADRTVTHAENARVPEGAVWTQHYFPSSDGVELHADVLLPAGLAAGERVPLILSAGSYFGHAGQMAPEDFPHTGPSDRFGDLITEGRLLERGYGLVMVDTRGFGGSTGCLDFAGPGEQADVRAAIDWAAAQPWSTGSVGMYGKSYDAITGLVGANLNHPALKGVVAQEPIWDLHRNFWSNGVPRSTITAAAGEYNAIARMAPLPDDDPRYQANAGYETAHPECLLLNTVVYQDADPAGPYWGPRDLAGQAGGSDTPLFVMQGFLEWSTEPEGVQEYLDNHRGPQRGWLGQWDHKRGNDRTADGRLETGREGWFDEVFSFYDEHLKGIAATTAYPAFAVQDGTGAWRAQDTWPMVQRSAALPLGGGTYTDDGVASSFVTRSEPLAQATRITGTPRFGMTTEAHGNVLVELHDIAPDGRAIMFDRQAAVVRPGETAFDLRSTDWTLPAGHSLAVEIGTIAPGFELDNDWIDSPSRERIVVRDARLDVALDDPADDVPLPGASAAWLDTYRLAYTAPLPGGSPTFTLDERNPR